MIQKERNKPGRPKDIAAGETILKTTLKLLREQGYRNVTIGMIAKEAGVARQTLYNRWPTKADLVLDALFERADQQAKEPSLGSSIACAQHLERFLMTVFDHLKADGATLCALIAAAQEDSDFRTVFWGRFVFPRELLVTRILEEAVRRNELPSSADPSTLSSMIHGAFWYRLLNGLSLDHSVAKSIIGCVFTEPRGVMA